MNNDTLYTAISSLISVAGLWWLVFWLYRDYLDELRAYLDEMRDIEAMMPSEAEWDILTAAFPPPENW